MLRFSLALLCVTWCLCADAMTPPDENAESMEGSMAFEDFDSYGDTCPLANDGFAVEEYPMGRKHLANRGDKPAWAFREEWPQIAGREQVDECEFSFRFLFGGEKRELQARLATMAEGKPVFHAVTIRADRIALSGPAGGWGASQQALLADLGIAPLLGRTWYRCRIESRAGFVRVWMEDRGEWVKVAENTAPLAAATGINLSVHPGTQVGSLRLRRLPPLQQAPTELRVTIPADADTASLAFSVGQAPTARLSLHHEDGTSTTITPVIRADTMTTSLERDGKLVREKLSLPDAMIDFQGLKLTYHSRPYARRYTDEQAASLQRNWERFPAASQRIIHWEFRLDGEGAQLWLDGRYGGRLESPSRLREVVVQLPSNSSAGESRVWKRVDAESAYLPLDVAFVAKPGALTDARVSLSPGALPVEGVPMIVVDGANHADVSVVKEMKGSWALEADEFLARGAFDGMPEALQFSVPLAHWRRAWILCAAELDPSKDAMLTASLSRSAVSGRGDAIAATTVTLPRGEEAAPATTRRVGTVTYATANGEVSVPLWLVEVPLDLGRILDLLDPAPDPRATLKIGPYLDFTLMGKPDRAYQQLDRRHKPDPLSTSGVHVFGLTLERAPVAFRLTASQPGNIFHNDESPMTTAWLQAEVGGTYALTWEIQDEQGKTIATEQRQVNLASGEEAPIEIALAMPNPGWYGITFTVLDTQGKTILTHEAAFALLGRDRREAGYDSPYGTWWFGGAHYGSDDIAIAGPMLHKAGLRRTTFGWSKAGEAEMAPWTVGLNQMGRGFNLNDLQNFDAASQREEKRIKELIARFPHCSYVLVYHESYNNAVPPELRDAAAPEAGEREQQMVALGNLAGAFYREKFPQLKLVWGNSSASAAIIAMLLRHGLDPSYIDYIGIETPGQTAPPEVLWEGATQGMWLAREAARKLGHDLPLTGCYEYTARSERDLGPRRQAEWIARDILLGLAYRFPTVSPAILHDVGNAYYNTLWGAGGLAKRAPLYYPKPAYVAVATLTTQLDGVTLRRELPTGSATVYGLEFDRRGESVYALWTVRGEATLALVAGDDSPMTQVDMYGRESILPDGQPLRVSTSPCYLVTKGPLRSVEVIERTYPADQPRPDFRIANAMDDASQWKIGAGNRSLDAVERHYLPWRTAGEFDLRQVVDEEKGACLELEMKAPPNPSLSPLVGEYTVLRLKEPVALEGSPHTLGVWVKGNSNWGKVMWEIIDGEGEIWRSSGTGGWGCDILDWPAETAVNFDGWAFLRMPLSESSPDRTINPGGVVSQWICEAGGNKRIDFPIRLSALAVTMYRHAVVLTEMQPLEKLTLRFRDSGTQDFEP